MQKFYADSRGNYLGSFDGTTLPEEIRSVWLAAELAKFSMEVVEVPTAPNHAAAIWNGWSWDEPNSSAPERSVAEKIAALEAALINKGVIAKSDVEQTLE